MVPDCGAAGGLEDWLVKAYDGEVLVEVRAGGLGHADRDPFGSSTFEYLEVILTARRTSSTPWGLHRPDQVQTVRNSTGLFVRRLVAHR